MPNLKVYFTRFGTKLSVTNNSADFKTGDFLTRLIHEKLPHIGIVTNRKSVDGKRNSIIYDVRKGQVL